MNEQKTLFELIGGIDRIRELVDRFYDLMDLNVEYTELRNMHPVDLSNSREKLFLFLSGWMGGPDLYSPKHGHPMLRARHLSFPIGDLARNQWTDCMFRTMEDVGIINPLKDQLKASFIHTANWMKNLPA